MLFAFIVMRSIIKELYNIHSFNQGWSATNGTDQFLFSTINEPFTLLPPVVILIRSVSPVLTSNEPLELLFPVVILIRSVSSVLTSNEPLELLFPVVILIRSVSCFN